MHSIGSGVSLGLGSRGTVGYVRVAALGNHRSAPLLAAVARISLLQRGPALRLLPTLRHPSVPMRD